MFLRENRNKSFRTVLDLVVLVENVTPDAVAEVAVDVVGVVVERERNREVVAVVELRIRDHEAFGNVREVDARPLPHRDVAQRDDDHVVSVEHAVLVETLDHAAERSTQHLARTSFHVRRF